MRRMLVLVVAFAVLLVLPGTAFAQETPSGEQADLVLATSAGEPAGPEPAPREQEDNPARELAGYEDQETPFTWGAAWILAALGFGGLAVMLVVYRVFVVGPSRDRTSV